jgi:transcriptional regulator with XRE-family HTH domain
MRENLEKVQLRVGRNIRHLRRLRGWTLEQLAERVEMTGKHVGDVERGKVKKLDVALLTKVAQTFAVDVGELFSGAANDTTGAPLYVTITQQDFERIEEALQILDRLRARARLRPK